MIINTVLIIGIVMFVATQAMRSAARERLHAMHSATPRPDLQDPNRHNITDESTKGVRRLVRISASFYVGAMIFAAILIPSTHKDAPTVLYALPVFWFGYLVAWANTIRIIRVRHLLDEAGWRYSLINCFLLTWPWFVYSALGLYSSWAKHGRP